MPSKPRNFNPEFCYHIYNRGVVEKREVFLSHRDYQRFLDAMGYYLYNQTLSYAQFQNLPRPAKKHYLSLDPKGLRERKVKLLAYCLMPNHFHLLMRPKDPADISRFMSDIANSYTRYFNIKYERSGALFQGTFKAKEITSEASLLQVGRYIHLNPVVSSKTNPRGMLGKPEDYPYSSYLEWIGLRKPYLADEGEVREWLAQIGGPKKYKSFVESMLKTNPALGIENLVIETS